MGIGAATGHSARALASSHLSGGAIGRLIGFACLTLAPGAAWAAPDLSPAWTDHAVIQRDAPIVVEGQASPKERISGRLGDQAASAVADERGAFTLSFPARPADRTPLVLRVTGADGTASETQDLVIGDVWLCSGQSNMEYPVENALNGDMVARTSDDPDLRLLQIVKGTASVPANQFKSPARWVAASPASTPQFSAACYFMGKSRRAQLHIPIGLIHASWGGSRLRPWLSPDAAESLYGKGELSLLRQHSSDPLGAVTAFAPQWLDWYSKETGGSTPLSDPAQLKWADVPAIGNWNDWAGTPLARNANGTVWLRRSIVLTEAQARAGGTLSLGIIDDMDMTFVNGRAVGNTFSWDEARQYRIPPAMLRKGTNEIMVAISNSWDKGGFVSSADHLKLEIRDGATLPLSSGWRYSIAPVRSFPPRPPWDGNGGIGVMHNRMVAPLGHIALKGAAWYQGESDVDVPGYADRLRALFAGWRRQFSASMRMLVVQLANYGAPQTKPAASGWATVRDDQRVAAVGDANAALVSAIDLGERTDIHPANKLLLGDRLAMAAQGIALPMPRRAQREGKWIRIQLTGVERGLQVWSGLAPLSFELCGADQQSCRYAQARIDGADILLDDDGRPITRVRYAWADSPIVNLFDGRALPVPGFEMAVLAQ